MAQTPSTLISEGAVLDYTPSGEIAAGDVTIVNSMPTLAEQAIAANAEGGISTGGVWRVPKITGAVSLFAAVYWDADADPVSGTAGSGAATTTAADNTFLGFAVASALSGGATVDVLRVLLPPPRPLDVTAVAAAGSAQGDAAALALGLNVVSAADGTKGVKLPAAAAGRVVFVKSTTAGQVLKVYPATGDAINALSANTALSLASGATPAILVAADAATWYTFPLLPS